ncbi:MAG: hypothetical protein DMG97_19400, partial [Acidobacteria bacterium]
NAFGDFLFGTLAKGGHVQVQNAYVSSRAWSYNFFVQDDFKLSAKLTLNLGLRWQYDQSFREIHHGDAFYEPCAVLFTHGTCVPHWEQFGVNAPETPFDPSKKQFEPRIGFAWNPRGGFVVRGGYGIMHPGAIGHGRAGDGEPGPNLLANTQFNAGTNWGNLGAITSPDPANMGSAESVSDIYPTLEFQCATATGPQYRRPDRLCRQPRHAFANQLWIQHLPAVARNHFME